MNLEDDIEKLLHQLKNVLELEVMIAMKRKKLTEKIIKLATK